MVILANFDADGVLSSEKTSYKRSNELQINYKT
jgi:hypothetical protein